MALSRAGVFLGVILELTFKEHTINQPTPINLIHQKSWLHLLYVQGAKTFSKIEYKIEILLLDCHLAWSLSSGGGLESILTLSSSLDSSSNSHSNLILAFWNRHHRKRIRFPCDMKFIFNSFCLQSIVRISLIKFELIKSSFIFDWPCLISLILHGLTSLTGSKQDMQSLIRWRFCTAFCNGIECKCRKWNP